MITIQGKPVSEGLAYGKVFYMEQSAEAYKGHISDTAAEKNRLAKARTETVRELTALAEKCRTDAGEELAALFETHAMIAQDEDLILAMENLIDSENINAEYAAEKAGKKLADTLANMEDEYMRARAADILDVARRIRSCLSGGISQPPVFSEPVIIAAEDLSPSQTLLLDRRMILGFITRYGSQNSHTAILARALGIPAICGAGSQLDGSISGKQAYIDGGRGYMYVDPDPTICEEMDSKIAAQRSMRAADEALRNMDDITPDGRRLEIWCNIGSPADIPAVLDSGAKSIGLVRSEFLYLGEKSWPDEETQYAAYRRILEAMAGKRVVVRTLDIGADKQLPYFPMPNEINPALGMRGVRVSLRYPEIFRTQLRALLRASIHGKLAVMFPMITGVDELLECRRICDDIMAQLSAERIAFDRNVEIGIMIETPSAVLVADELARHTDFFSIGTNDLTQYLLACDRQNSGMESHWDPRHPSVMRAVRMAADAAHRAGKWVGICGEAASDADLLPQFLDMGIDELSVPPARVLSLRAALRRCGTQAELTK